MVPENLRKFYIEVERDNRVSVHNPTVKDIQNGVETIVHKIFKQAESADRRFKLNLVKTGSFYDDAKVIEPDEFDYVAELDALSRNKKVEFLATEDAAFLQVKLRDFELKKIWREFITDPRLLKEKSRYSMTHVSSDSDKPFKDQELKNNRLVLNPIEIQKHFRKLMEDAFQSLTLPSGWEYGGCNRPVFSGIRRHGPATMIQLIYRTSGEYKINVDITLGIALPCPVTPSDIKMNVLDRIPKDSTIRDDIIHCFTNGPCLHAIPLYSKMLVRTSRYENKNSWRVSCSGIEKHVFDKFAFESGVKVCMRMIKAIRDLFLAEDKRKTHREKRKRKRLADSQNIENEQESRTENPADQPKVKMSQMPDDNARSVLIYDRDHLFREQKNFFNCKQSTKSAKNQDLPTEHVRYDRFNG